MGNLKVIGGERRGFPLASPRSAVLRPTSNKVREALFDILGPEIVGARVLDLFAGTGAVGIEALSRGAAECLFIESNPAIAALVRTNLQTCRLQERGKVRVGSLPDALDLLDRPDFDLVFLDPPYEAELGAEVLERLGSREILASSGKVVFEHRKSRARRGPFKRLEHRRTVRYGDSELSFFVARGAEE